MKQETLLEQMAENESLPSDKPLLFFCKFHKWVCKQRDFIEVVIKKTGKKVWRCIYCEKMKAESKKLAKLDWKRHKDTLSDYYILTTFVRGNKMALPMNEYPQELIEAKRASLKLKRDIDKANEPLKTCNQHGKLFRDDVIKGGYLKSGDTIWRCKQCMKSIHAKNYELNKLKILKRLEQNRKFDPVKTRAIKRKSRLKHLDAERAKSRERFKIWAQRNPEANHAKEAKARAKRVDELLPNYVKEKLIRGTHLKTTDISPELMEASRAIMLLKRNIKIRSKEHKLSLTEGEQD